MTILRLGFKIYLDLESLFPHLVTPVLFLGPLYASYLGGYLPFQKYWSFRNSIVSRFFSWQGARNYVFVGPPLTLTLITYVRLQHLRTATSHLVDVRSKGCALDFWTQFFKRPNPCSTNVFSGTYHGRNRFSGMRPVSLPSIRRAHRSYDILLSVMVRSWYVLIRFNKCHLLKSMGDTPSTCSSRMGHIQSIWPYYTRSQNRFAHDTFVPFRSNIPFYINV